MSKKKIKPVQGLGGLSNQTRHRMIKEYLEGGQSKLAIWRKYTGQDNERGHLLRLMRQLGYPDTGFESEGHSKDHLHPIQNASLEDLKAYRDRIQELEKQLAEARLKVKTLERMAQRAEKKIGILTRKLSASK